MALLEDNQRLIIERFEKMLMELLQAHTDYQRQIIALTEENKRLKALLEASTTDLSRSTAQNHTVHSSDPHLVDQINKYIQEIDLCLAYFEQV
ncbi:hypothetical protein CE557_239 [Cardinium endosymbiont of Sogatella furcifera]|uniref:hypothetical protein n=1 Tax=Cardinium endosymbiont of Sogatella furcifera TaxID=650378 RepID=UPI000E0DE6E5|nr:hypothetical protein [Cardinium endosymbiont of Sogatella furcifera]AXI24073.1 hypothetical protein CE557_239 [Cardinium endosymbiont of Sogatella furcifera]